MEEYIPKEYLCSTAEFLKYVENNFGSEDDLEQVVDDFGADYLKDTLHEEVEECNYKIGDKDILFSNIQYSQKGGDTMTLNIGFVTSKGVKDETQLDLESVASPEPEDYAVELINLVLSLQKEMDIKKVLYIEEVEED